MNEPDCDLGNADDYSVYVQSMLGQGFSSDRCLAIADASPLALKHGLETQMECEARAIDGALIEADGSGGVRTPPR